MKNLFLVMTVLAILGVATSSASADWNLIGVGGDLAYPAIPGPGTISSANNLTGSALTFVLDMGSVVSANQIMLKNSYIATMLAIQKLNIYVAPDETAVGFVANDISSYSVLVGSGTSGGLAADLVSYFDITPCTKRYYMMEVTENFAGYINTTSGGYSDWVWLNDLQAGIHLPLPITAGTIFGVDDDLTQEYVEQVDYAAINPPSDLGRITFVLDLNSVKTVDSVYVKNTNESTSWNIAKVQFFTADESNQLFEPNDASFYTIDAGSGLRGASYLPPSTYAWYADIEQRWDLFTNEPNPTKRTCRYLMFSCENGFGTENVGNTLVRFIDIKVAVSPDEGVRIIPLAPDSGPSFPDHNDRNAYAYNGGSDGDKLIDLVMDLRTVKDIQQIIVFNDPLEITNYNIKSVKIRVAPSVSGGGSFSENDPSFDMTVKSNYSVEIYNGDLLPLLNIAGAKRIAEVTNVSRQYVLLEVQNNFWGNFGLVESGMNLDIFTGAFDFLGTDSIRTCDDVVSLGLTLDADLNKDCYVNMQDVKMLADEWIQCTTPGAAGCAQTAGSMPTYYIEPVPSDGIEVNGDLSDWPANSEWIYLTELYYGYNPYDIKEAKMSLRWDSSTDKIYAAVIVEDPDHHFLNDPNYIGDLIEVYSQGDAAGGTDWGAGGTKYFDAAQQYFVGKKNTTGSWAAWADLTSIGSSAGFESAVTLDGDKIIYELGVKQFDNYGGISGSTTVVTELTPGHTVGFDIIANTVHGSSLFSMLSENTFTGKSADAGQFQRYELANSLPQQYCGDWGYMASDVTYDCRVNLADFAKLGLEWLTCNDPEGQTCTPNW